MNLKRSVARRPVLIVDDSDDDTFLICRAIRRAQVPWTITNVLANGEQAIRYLEKICHCEGQETFPDVLFLDIQMPRKNGFEVLEWIHDSLPKGTIKVVIASISTQPSDKVRAIALGADDYIVKPASMMDHVDLMLKVERTLTNDVSHSSAWLRTSLTEGSARQ